MTWRYQQSTGKLWQDEMFVGIGYSGHGVGKNNPADHERGEGPIPVGGYTIGEPHDTQTHGPFVMPLIPDPENEMWGRSGFLMHGDSIKLPGEASHGCVIMSRAIREQVWMSGDRRLEVFA